MRNQSKKFPRLSSPDLLLPSRTNRRDFLRTTSLTAGALAFGVPTLLRGQNLNSKLNIACIGIGGKGRSDTDACASENIVAVRRGLGLRGLLDTFPEKCWRGETKDWSPPAHYSQGE